MKRLAVSAGLLSLAMMLPAAAQDFSFGIPVDCAMGQDCFIQQFVDTDPGPGARDFMCGHLTYDGHKGTDFRVRDRQMMRDGVPVIASGAGVVLGVRDGMQDVDVSTIGGRKALQGKDCGNGVLIDHGNGWTSQYCHLRRGSVQVRKGQEVNRGQQIGLVGMSGAAEFPHVHVTLRKNKEVVDPYRGVAPRQDCGGKYPGLWSGEVMDAVRYRPGGILTIGLFGRADLTYLDIREGRANPAEISATSPALVAWAHLYGPQKGDQVRVNITAPDGSTFYSGETKPHPRNQAAAYRLLGRKNRGTLATGTYTVLVELIRGGQVYDAWQTTTTVR